MFNVSASTNGTGRGSVGGLDSNGWYNAGSVVSNMAVANAESYFSGWLGTENLKSNPASFTMNGARNEEAIFKRKPIFRGMTNAVNPHLKIEYLDFGSN